MKDDGCLIAMIPLLMVTFVILIGAVISIFELVREIISVREE